MNHFFLDSSFLIALESSDDQYFISAKKLWKSIIENQLLLTTTSYVFDEVVTFFNNRNHHSKAVQIGESLLNSSIVRFIHIDPELFIEGWTFFKKHSDKSYSLTDCISFIIMDKLEIKTDLTFDHHFIQAGFQIFPLLNE